MNYNMTKATARLTFKRKTNYKLCTNFEMLSLNVAQSKHPRNKYN